MVSLRRSLAPGTAEGDTIRSFERNTREGPTSERGENRREPGAWTCEPKRCHRPPHASIPSHCHLLLLLHHRPRRAPSPLRRRPPDPGTPSVLPLFSVTSSPSQPPSPGHHPLPASPQWRRLGRWRLGGGGGETEQNRGGSPGR